MYNLDISTAMAASAAMNNSATPRTPEIVNSLIAMTSPLDDYNFGVNGGGGQPATKRFCANSSSDSNSSHSSQESHQPQHHHLPPQPAPSVQQTCSQLIKAGLKLSIEQKRKLQHDHEDLLDLDKIKRIKRNESESEEDKHHNGNELTPEDEERRRRRRERNKIAATKCRLKKRERTANLISESETLETANVELKSQFSALRKEKEKLEEVLRLHKASCQKELVAPTNRLPPVNSIDQHHHHHLHQQQHQHQHHSYNQPAAAPTSTATTTAAAVDAVDTYQTHCIGDFDPEPMYTLQYKTPSIIVESIHDDDHYPSLTDLDNPDESSFGYNYVQAQSNYGHGIDSCMA